MEPDLNQPNGSIGCRPVSGWPQLLQGSPHGSQQGVVTSGVDQIGPLLPGPQNTGSAGVNWIWMRSIRSFGT